ncbi:hypothetical protein BCA37_22340 [Mycobacterium sp. djl-10]|nr:hypothetical protein BCA37_22340 [Mycobacterium sp. djl-10]
MARTSSWAGALFTGLAAAGIALAPGASAEQPNVYGVITPDESREITANGASTCATLARSASTAALTPDDVSLLIDGYLADGWDDESTADILTASVDRGCGQYLPQVSQALTAHLPG